MVSNHLALDDRLLHGNTHTEKEKARRNLTEIPHLGSGSELIRGEPKADIPMETKKTIMYCTLASPKSAMDRLWIWKIYSYVHMYVLYYADSTWMFFWEGIDVML